MSEAVRLPDWVEKRDQAQTALKGLPFVAVPIEQLADVYERLLRLTHMGTAHVSEWVDMPKGEKDLRHAVFGQAEFGALFAGQWLPREVQDSVYERVKDELKDREA